MSTKDVSGKEEKQQHREIQETKQESAVDTNDMLAVSNATPVPGALPLDWTRVQPPRPPAQQQQQDDDGDGDDDGEDDHSHDGQHPVVRYPWEVIDIEKNEEEIFVVGTAGQKITRMGYNLGDYCSPHLKKLVFRSNLIRVMEGLHTFEELELLELYDNMIETLGALNEGRNRTPGTTLRVLDMSYNVIRDMTPVNFCPNLRELYLAQNKIKSMSGLSSLKHLVKIDLGANRLRRMDPNELGGLTNLEELWLGKNKIEKIEGLEKLTKLRRLDIQSNRLTRIQGLESQVDTLEELYLAHNGITNAGVSLGLSLPFTRLSTLDLSRNVLTSTEPFANLTTLEEMWISGNKIETFDQIRPLSNLIDLDTVYLEYNPIADDFEYRKKLKEIIPSLKQIDANIIRNTESGSGGGAGSGKVETLEDQMRRLQDMALRKAQAQQLQRQQEDAKDGGGKEE